MQRYINTNSGLIQECFFEDKIKDGVIEAPNDHPFFQHLPLNHKVVHNGLNALPTIEPLNSEEQAIVDQAVADHAAELAAS